MPDQLEGAIALFIVFGTCIGVAIVRLYLQGLIHP
jgi:hypothetical protein